MATPARMSVYVPVELKQRARRSIPPERSFAGIFREALEVAIAQAAHESTEGCRHERVATTVTCLCCGNVERFGG